MAETERREQRAPGSNDETGERDPSLTGTGQHHPIEAEDGFLRLDKELGSLLDFLDSKVGKGQYTVFLSADHGVANIPEYMKENKMPGGRIFVNDVTKQMNKLLNEKYKLKDIVVYDDNYQIGLNHPAIDSAKADTENNRLDS